MDLGQLDYSHVVTRQETLGNRLVRYTDVAIVGNGPSGLAMSAFLSGWRPFYDLSNPHPSRIIHHKLANNSHISLIDQDLSWVEDEFDNGDQGGGVNTKPMSTFYDSLVRPDVDVGHEHPSALKWEKPNDYVKRVPHVVIGKGKPGGSWHDFAPEVNTLSLQGWMDLPGCTLGQWAQDTATEKENGTEDLNDFNGRVACYHLQNYFRDYPKQVGISDHQLPYTTVTSVQRVEADQNDPFTLTHPWRVTAFHHSEGVLTLRAKKVVLATGVSVPRHLAVAGENIAAVSHDLRTGMDRILQQNQREHPVLVVGDGLSAADAVFFCLVNDIEVLHVFRKTVRELKHSMLGRLSANKYPEYHAVARLMQGKVRDDRYTPLAATHVTRFDALRTACVSTVTSHGKSNTKGFSDQEEKRLNFSYALVCVGFEANLNFLPKHLQVRLTPNVQQAVDSKRNRIKVERGSYRSSEIDDLYCVGPLVGDNFVRFLVGGSLGAARDIIHTYEDKVLN